VRTDWPRVALLVACGVFTAFQIGKVPASLLTIRADLDLGLVAAGWVIALYSATGSLIGLAAGVVTDRLGHRRTLLGGLLCAALAAVAGSQAISGTGLLISRFFEGLGFILTVVSVPTLMLRLTASADRAKIMGLWGAYMPTGTATMILLSPLALATIGWRGLWLVIAGLLLCLAVGVWLITRGQEPQSSSAHNWGGVQQTLARPGPWLIALCFGVYAGQFIAVMGFLPTLLVGLGLAGSAAAGLTALAVAANILGNLAIGPLMGRGWPRWVLIVAAGLTMAAADLVIFQESWPLVWRFGAVVLLSAVGGVIPGSLMAGAAFHAPTPGLLGTTTGLMMQGANLGQMLTPPAVAALVAATGQWEFAPLVLLPLALASVGIGLVLRKVEQNMQTV